MMKALLVWAVMAVVAAAQEGNGTISMMPGIHYNMISIREGRMAPHMEHRRPMRVPLNTREPSGSRPVGEYEASGEVNGNHIIFPDLTDVWGTRRVDYNFAEESVMELPEDMNVESMGMDAMMALSDVSTMEDYAAMFGVELPTESPEIAARFGGGTAVDAVSANCEPENKTVVLALPIELNVMYFPRCVRLQRCGGCCQGTMLSCQPTKVTPITLKVMRIEADASAVRSRGSRRGGSRIRSRRRRNTVRYYTADEQHHIACSCLCRVKAEHCDPILHTYMQAECLCRCNNRDEKEKCERKPSTHYWANDECTCYCQKVLNCSTGEFYNHTSCRCERNPLLLRKRNADINTSG